VPTISWCYGIAFRSFWIFKRAQGEEEAPVAIEI
jgi:hypothetical protein